MLRCLQLEEFKAKKAAAGRKSSSGSAGATSAFSPPSGASQSAAVPPSPEHHTSTPSSRQPSQDGQPSPRTVENGLPTSPAQPPSPGPAIRQSTSGSQRRFSQTSGVQETAAPLPVPSWEIAEPALHQASLPATTGGQSASQQRPTESAVSAIDSRVSEPAAGENGSASLPPKPPLTVQVPRPAAAIVAKEDFSTLARVSEDHDSTAGKGQTSSEMPLTAAQQLVGESSRIATLEQELQQMQEQVCLQSGLLLYMFQG